MDSGAMRTTAGDPAAAGEDPVQATQDGDAGALLSHGEISRRATAGAMTIMVRGLAVRGVGMLGNIALARLLLPRDFGIISFGATIVMFGDFLASGGLGAALVRQPGRVQRADLQAVFGFQLLLTIGLSVLVTAIGVPLGEAGAVAAIMMWSLVIDTGRAPTAIPLEREMAYRVVLQAEVIETIAWNAFAVAAVAAGFGVWGVAAAQIVRALTGFLFLTLRGPTGFLLPRLQWSRTRPLLSLGAQFQGVQAVQVVRDQGFGIAIAAIGGFAALGLWSIVYRLTTVVTILMESLWRVSFPAMSRLRETGSDLVPVVERALAVASALTGFLVAPLAGAAPALIPVVFGPHWTAAVDVLPLAAGAIMLAGPVLAVSLGYLLSEGRAGVLLRMGVLDALAAAAVGLPLLATIGVIGLGFGQIALGLTDLAVLALALRKGSRINALRPTVGPLLAVAGAAVPAWLLSSSLGANVPSLVASLATAEVLYLALLLLVRRASAIDALQIGWRTARRLAHAA